MNTASQRLCRNDSAIAAEHIPRCREAAKEAGREGEEGAKNM
jgi:hypothetical protein